jgi:hypothetical protein
MPKEIDITLGTKYENWNEGDMTQNIESLCSNLLTTNQPQHLTLYSKDS